MYKVEQKEYFEMAKISDEIRNSLDEETYDKLFSPKPIPTSEEIEQTEEKYKRGRREKCHKDTRRFQWLMAELDWQLPDRAIHEECVKQAFDKRFKKYNFLTEVKAFSVAFLGFLLFIGFTVVVSFMESHFLFVIPAIVLLLLTFLCWPVCEVFLAEAMFNKTLDVSLNDYSHAIPDRVASIIGHLYKEFEYYGGVIFRVRHTVPISRYDEMILHKGTGWISEERDAADKRWLAAQATGLSSTLSMMLITNY